jgi:Uma2 family endonuclease
MQASCFATRARAMARALSTSITAEEFFDFANLAENRDRHLDLIEGRVVESPLRGEQHGFVCANGVFQLSRYLQRLKTGYVCSNNVGFVLERNPDTVIGPDICLFLESRKFKELELNWPKQLPNLIIEVLSPNDRQAMMRKRVNKFLEKGVGMAWLVDPEAQALTIFLPNRNAALLERDDEMMGLKLLPDFRCKVAAFFKMPGE